MTSLKIVLNSVEKEKLQTLFLHLLFMRYESAEACRVQSAKGEERGDRERNPWLAKMLFIQLIKHTMKCGVGG